MNYGKLNYVIVGGFVIAMLAGLIVALAMLTGRTGATDAYHVVYRNVTGIKFGTQVVYEGYPIGQVEDVVPEPSEGGMRFRVDFSVKEGWRIPEDSIAEIAAPGLLAAFTISIRAGESATALEPGGQVQGREAANMFAVVAELAGQFGELAESRIKPLLDTIGNAFGTATDVMDGDGRMLIKELRTLAQYVSDRAPAIVGNIEQTAEAMSAAAGEFRLLINEENRAKIVELVDDLDTAAKSYNELAGKMDALMASLKSVVEGNRANIDESIADMRYIMNSVSRDIDSINQNLEATSRNMYEFSRQIRQNPGLLLGGTAPRDAANRR